MFSVEIFVVHGFDAWKCGDILHMRGCSSEKFGPINGVNRNCRLVRVAPPPNFLPLIPNLIAAHPLLFVCSISFNIFTATVHAVGRAMSLNFRMTH